MQTKMKYQRILCIAGTFYPRVNGAVTILKNFVQAAIKSGTNVFVYTAEINDTQIHRENWQGISIIRSRELRRYYETANFDFPNIGRELFTILDEYQPDLICVNDLFAVLPACLVREKVRIPLVAIYHETPMPPQKIIGRIFDQPLLEWSLSRLIFGSLPYDLMIAPSQYFYDWAITNGAPHDRIIRHYFGVDLQRYSPTIPLPSVSRYKFPDDTLLILSSARVVPRKRLEDLLYAIPLVLESHPNVNFGFTWRTEETPRTYLNRLETIILELGIQNHIFRLNNLNDDEMPGLYRKATVCVLTSQVEGLGLSLLEAQACGCSTIGSDVPGIREVIRHQETGLLYPVTNYNELAKCINQSIEDKKMSKYLANKALDRVHQTFNQEKSMSDLFCIINDIIPHYSW